MDIVNAGLSKLPCRVTLDAEQIARNAGSAKVANIVMLGAATPFIGIEYNLVQEGIRRIFHRKGNDAVRLNLEALKAGLDATEFSK